MPGRGAFLLWRAACRFARPCRGARAETHLKTRPSTMRTDPHLHYLDTPPPPWWTRRWADSVNAAMRSCWANPSSLYEPAILAENKLSAASRQNRQNAWLRQRRDLLYRLRQREQQSGDFWARPSPGKAGAIRSSPPGLSTPASSGPSGVESPGLCGGGDPAGAGRQP